MGAPAASVGSPGRDPVGGPACGEPDPWRRVWWAAFAVFALLGGVWSLSVPLGEGPDEPAHVIKATAVARGQLQTSFVRQPAAFGSTRPDTTVRVPQAYAEVGKGADCYRGELTAPASCAPGIGDQTRTVEATTYVGSYPPWYYLAVGWPSLVAPPHLAVHLMRLVSVLLCAVFLASAAASVLRPGASGLAGACAALAVTPAVLYLMGSVNPNSLEIAAAIAVWASLVDLVTREGPIPTRLIVRVSVAAVVLVSLRALSPAFLVVIVVLVGLFAGRQRIVELARDPRIRWSGSFVAVVAVAATLYVVLARTYEVIDFPEPPGSTRLGLGRDQLLAAGAHEEQAIGLVSWRGLQEVRTPRVVSVVWLSLALVCGATAAVAARRRERIVLGLVLLGIIALPAAAATATASASWQGRYALPLAVGLPILSSCVLGRLRGGRVASGIAVALASAVALGWVATWERRMTKNLVGLPSSPFAGIGSGRWTGPLTPVVLLVGLLIGALALPAAIALRCRAAGALASAP